MSGQLVLDRQKLVLAFSEVEFVRKSLPQDAVSALAQEVVRRVAGKLGQKAQSEFQLTTTQIDALCTALLSSSDDAAVALISQAQQAGASHDVLYESMLGEAARRLGSWWDDDKVSFYQVSVAAGRIYAILRILRLQRLAPSPDLRRSAIFASVPGEDHTLGITIAADMARERGWDIELFVGHGHEELIALLERRDTCLIGLSAGTRRSLPALIRLIVSLRLSNPSARILICGQIAARNLNLEGITGADACAADFDMALAEMERLSKPDWAATRHL